MPPSAQDPNLKPIPDFISQGYQAIRNLIIAQAPNTTPEHAVEQIQMAYNADKQTQIEAWNEQVRQEQEAEEQQAQQLREEEVARQEEEDRLIKIERKEQEKKKPKINDFNEN